MDPTWEDASLKAMNTEKQGTNGLPDVGLSVTMTLTGHFRR